MKYHDLFYGLFLTILSLCACSVAYRLGLGDIHSPGAGLVPFGTAALLGLMSIGMVIRSLFKGIKGRQEKNLFQGIRWKTLILVLCVLFGYGIFLNTLGFRICTFLIMVLLLGEIGRKKWWLTLTISVLIVIVTDLIFVILLDCEFPKGFLGI